MLPGRVKFFGSPFFKKGESAAVDPAVIAGTVTETLVKTLDKIGRVGKAHRQGDLRYGKV